MQKLNNSYGFFAVWVTHINGLRVFLWRPLKITVFRDALIIFKGIKNTLHLNSFRRNVFNFFKVITLY